MSVQLKQRWADGRYQFMRHDGVHISLTSREVLSMVWQWLLRVVRK